MSGYRRVNYYELCRLCTSSEGTKMHIFREEGRRRQLPTKIQMCLPLQVSEEDSLPKIVCSQCVERLDTMYEFRNSCVTAEAMLESYFTSLRYSEDFIREGKVYVKDMSPTKKKNLTDMEKSTIKVPNVQALTSIPVTVDSLNNLVQTATIQIVNQNDADIARQPQYKCIEMGTNSETPNVRFSYEACSSADTHTTTTVALLKAEESTQTDNNKQNHSNMNPGTASYYLRLPNHVESGNEGQNEQGEVVEEEQLHQTITFAPNHGHQEVIVFDFNKEKDQNNTTTILRSDDRTSIAQIGEFLRMKTAVVVEDGGGGGNVEEEPQNSEVVSRSSGEECKQCGSATGEHELGCPAATDDKGGGTFACDVCPKMFKRKEHLFQHSKLHSGERPYSCMTCGKAFSRKEHLIRHSVSHTGQKSYACDLCTKSFSRKDNLHKHRKTHGVAGPYICEVCGKSFVVKHYYIVHKQTHATSDSPDDPLPYRCEICYKGFAVKSYLVSHKQRHRGRNAQHAAEHNSQGQHEEEEDPLAPSTVNATAILPPNIVHQGPTGTPLFHVSTGTNTTTYLTTAVVDNYRRLHPS